MPKSAISGKRRVCKSDSPLRLSYLEQSLQVQDFPVFWGRPQAATLPGSSRSRHLNSTNTSFTTWEREKKWPV